MGSVRATSATKAAGIETDRERPAAQLLLVTLGCCLVAAILATWPLIRYAASRVPTDLGDPLLNVWTFAWAEHALAHNPIHLFAANEFFPERHTLAFTESLLGLSIPMAPLYWLTRNPVLVVNIASLLIYAIGGVGMYLLVREFTGRFGPALVAALAFTVAPYRLVSIGHTHVIALHVIPFVLWALVRRKRVWIVAVLVALQFYSSLTGATLMLVALAGWGGWELLRRRMALIDVGRAALGIGIGVLLSIPGLIPYFLARHEHPEYRHPPSTATTFGATPGSYLSAQPFGRIARPLETRLDARFRNLTTPWEKTLFPGVWTLIAGVSALVLGALWFVRRIRVRDRWPPWTSGIGMFVIVGSIALVLSFGPRWGGRPSGVPLPFALMMHVLPGNFLRVPARIGQLVILALAGLGGIALAQLPKRLRAAGVALSIVLLALESVPAALPMLIPPQITSAHRALARTKGGILILPTAVSLPNGRVYGPSLAIETQAMYLSTAHFRPITNGYGAFVPRSAAALYFDLRAFPTPRGMSALRALDVRTVVIRMDAVRSTRWETSRARLERWPGVRLFAADELTRAYDITRAALPIPAQLPRLPSQAHRRS